MTEKMFPRFLCILLCSVFLAFFFLGAAEPLGASTQSPPLSDEVVISLARLETALLMRERGVAHEATGRRENAVRSYEESLALFPDPEVEKRIELLKRELRERAVPLAPPAPRQAEARAVRLERARELREDGKSMFVRGELKDAARAFEQSLLLFEDEALSRFVDGMKKEMELVLSLEGLEDLFD